MSSQVQIESSVDVDSIPTSEMKSISKIAATETSVTEVPADEPVKRDCEEVDDSESKQCKTTEDCLDKCISESAVAVEESADVASEESAAVAVEESPDVASEESAAVASEESAAVAVEESAAVAVEESATSESP